MFGIIKENILDRLEKAYGEKNEKELKDLFVKYTKTIKENKDLRRFHEVYSLFRQVNFKDKEIAREFVEESIEYLNKFDKSKVKLIKKLIENTEIKSKHTVEYKLDQLIFNENLSWKDRLQNKTELVNLITNKDTNLDYEKNLTKVNENIEKLTENQKKVLELFIENDTKKIRNFYDNLISETEKIVEDKIVECQDLDVIKKLVEVKRKLNLLKNQNPSIDEIDSIIDLKESF